MTGDGGEGGGRRLRGRGEWWRSKGKRTKEEKQGAVEERKGRRRSPSFLETKIVGLIEREKVVGVIWIICSLG